MEFHPVDGKLDGNSSTGWKNNGMDGKWMETLDLEKKFGWNWT